MTVVVLDSYIHYHIYPTLYLIKTPRPSLNRRVEKEFILTHSSLLPYRSYITVRTKIGLFDQENNKP